MIYILIGLLYWGDTGGPVRAEFNSQGACELAKANIQREFAGGSSLVCVAKG